MALEMIDVVRVPRQSGLTAIATFVFSSLDSDIIRTATHDI